ncbi:hypothetical protein [Lysobacter gummosus]|uniref:hypothetical protein n=1 Tax=Lysobacter gummosus TaxID=262324 RepID=UPI003644148B
MPSQSCPASCGRRKGRQPPRSTRRRLKRPVVSSQLLCRSARGSMIRIEPRLRGRDKPSGTNDLNSGVSDNCPYAAGPPASALRTAPPTSESFRCARG